MDISINKQSKKLLTNFIIYCQLQKIEPTLESLNVFYSSIDNTSKPKQKLKINTRINTTNDYLKFTKNCRNNGFCVQEFNSKPAVFTDYINCPDSKLVVFNSSIDCIVIKYKLYNIVSPKNNINYSNIEYETNPITDQQLYDIDYESDTEIILDIIHWTFEHTNYLVDTHTQKVYLNNDFIGTRINKNDIYYINTI